MKKLLPIILVASMTGGCAQPRTKIELPPRGAPLAERVKAYRAYRPVSKTTVTSSDASKQEWLTLANGEYLYVIDDMLPAVLPTSDTAKHVQASKQYDVPIAIGSFTMLGGLAGGLATGFAGEFDEPLPIGLFVVGGVAAVATIILQSIAGGESSRAFDTYHADLMDRLALEPEEEAVDADDGTAWRDQR